MFEKLLSWSKSEYGNLPWRKKRTLYRTVVSEFMLQQTTVGTVVNKFENFVKQFQDFQCLFKCSEEEIIKVWKGLGYYRRARNLRNLAITVVQELNGKLPENKADLLEIPGIGEYCAAAIESIGRDHRALAIDANIERVLSRVFLIDGIVGKDLKNKLNQFFNEDKVFNSISSFRLFNEAIMDLGRVICQKNKTSCKICPLKENCQSFKLGVIKQYPKYTKKIANKETLQLVRFIVLSKGKILGTIKDQNEWLNGQIELPTFIIECSDKNLKQYPKLTGKHQLSPKFEFKSVITKYKITNQIVVTSMKDFQTVTKLLKRYQFFDTIKELNLTSSSIKALKLAGEYV